MKKFFLCTLCLIVCVVCFYPSSADGRNQLLDMGYELLLYAKSTIQDNIYKLTNTVVEDVKVEFWFSTDEGETYAQEGISFPEWGSSIYMKLKIQVHTNRNTKTFHSVALHIENSENVTSYILDGPIIQPRATLTHIIYDFSTVAVQNNDKYTELYVEFIPFERENINIKVEFDDSVPEKFDEPLKIVILG